MEFFEISLTNLLLWLFAAIFVGWLVDVYDRREVSGGIALTSIFAIFGALSVGYLMSFVSGSGMLGLNIDALLVTAVGASVFAFFYRFSFGKNS